jgi:hypothetical protein
MWKILRIFALKTNQQDYDLPQIIAINSADDCRHHTKGRGAAADSTL